MAALIEKSKKRIMKDVETASKSDEYKFHYNDEGVGYINFITPSGIYKKMNHIVEIKFIYGSGDTIYRYPFDPPLLTFVTPIWHPNIGKSGSVCLDFLKSKELWNPGCTIDSLIVIMTALLSDPNPDSPQNSEAAKDFTKMNEKEYRKICKKYYKTHFDESKFDMFSDE